MNIKIHMLDVGNADALIVCLDNGDKHLTLLVDGGREGHGSKVISFLKGIKKIPDIIICSHLDHDHIGGLVEVIKEYKDDILAIWAHQPKKHPEQRKDLLKYLEEGKRDNDERWGIIYASMKDLDDLIAVAGRIPVLEPFSDKQPREMSKICKEWSIEIMGPSVCFYEKLVTQFKNNVSTEGVDKIFLDEIKGNIGKPCEGIGTSGVDTPENESSVIFQISTGSNKYLFTGDAGLEAFTEIKSKLSKVYWLKVPHHGSKKNLSLNIIETLKPTKSFVSANGDYDHPHKNIIKCLEKHGSEVKCTYKSHDLEE